MGERSSKPKVFSEKENKAGKEIRSAGVEELFTQMILENLTRRWQMSRDKVTSCADIWGRGLGQRGQQGQYPTRELFAIFQHQKEWLLMAEASVGDEGSRMAEGWVCRVCSHFKILWIYSEGFGNLWQVFVQRSKIIWLRLSKEDSAHIRMAAVGRQTEAGTSARRQLWTLKQKWDRRFLQFEQWGRREGFRFWVCLEGCG